MLDWILLSQNLKNSLDCLKTRNLALYQKKVLMVELRQFDMAYSQ